MAKKTYTLEKTFAYILVVGGIIGFIAAFILTVDKFNLLKDPTIDLNCNINPILSCGSVMKTAEASTFGFANSLLGIMGFSVVTTIGMAMLAGAKFKRWFWRGLHVGTIFGIGFVHYLIIQSIFHIGALCPYCMVVWTVMIPIFIYTTIYNIRMGHIPVHARLKKLTSFIERHHGDIIVLWYAIIIGIIINHFWYYWKTLL